jgi:hypothetical protein
MGSRRAQRESVPCGRHAATEKGLPGFEVTRIILSALLLSGIRPGTIHEWNTVWQVISLRIFLTGVRYARRQGPCREELRQNDRSP